MMHLAPPVNTAVLTKAIQHIQLGLVTIHSVLPKTTAFAQMKILQQFATWIIMYARHRFVHWALNVPQDIAVQQELVQNV